MITEDFIHRIEMFSSSKAKLKVVEILLKKLNIEYKIVSSKTHTSRLKRLIFEQPLASVHDLLTSLDIGSKRYAEQLKKDFEARRYWRKQFQRFKSFQKSIRTS